MSVSFAASESVYQLLPPDGKASVLSVDGLPVDEAGRQDITGRLQALLDKVKTENNAGIVFVPEGSYILHDTVYVPRAVRLIGFGKKRPLFILPQNCAGYQQQERYMIWFTANVPARDGIVEDATPGTFYSALSNIDFRIEDGNPSAVAVRAHFAQNCYVSHCRFEIGQGLAGISDVGNEMENLIFCGGDYGIKTRKTSPGWPFVLGNSIFYNQRCAAVRSRECGLTFSRVHFRQVPAACVVEEGYWEKIFWKDSVFENISGPALQISLSGSSCTQVNLQNILLKNCPVLLLEQDTGKRVLVPENDMLLRSYTHGFCLTSDQIRREMVSEGNWEKGIFRCRNEFLLPPSAKNWHSVCDYGAAGDGITDDLGAIQRALDENEVVYLPQGFYRLSDSLKLNPGNILIGLNPVTTQLAIAENTPAFAGFGPPHPLLCSSRGFNMVSGIGIDTASRNPRAVGCKWTANQEAYMNDVKFVGGHGQIRKGMEDVPAYNPGRTGDADPDRPWHSQYASLWISEGGGIFKDIWSASPYASSGICITKTDIPGHMYQVSLEHHVRHELILRRVSSWSFYALQTEEEAAEGSDCQPIELSECQNITFANLYIFRVIWVDVPRPNVIRIWDCRDLHLYNLHNFTQMKYTAEQIILDMNSGNSIGFWQMANLHFTGEMKKLRTDSVICLPEYGADYEGKPELLVSDLDCADALCSDHRGHIYLCDSRIGKIYCWDQRRKTMTLVYASHFRPLSIACDTQGRLMVVAEYKPVKGAFTNGVPDLAYNDRFSLEATGGCFAKYYCLDRTIRVFVIDPEDPENSMEVLESVPIETVSLETVYFPLNQWRDSGDIMESVRFPIEEVYVSADQKTAIAATMSLARANCLSALRPGKPFFMVDEYGKRIIRAEVDEKFQMYHPAVFSDAGGEYGFAAKENGKGCLIDNYIYLMEEDRVKAAYRTPDRPACALFEKGTLFISARKGFYEMEM